MFGLLRSAGDVWCCVLELNAGRLAALPTGRAAIELELRLTHGSFRLSIAALIKAFITAARHEPVYPDTCTDLISVTGTTPIVAGSGAGLISGSAAASGHPYAERG